MLSSPAPPTNDLAFAGAPQCLHSTSLAKLSRAQSRHSQLRLYRIGRLTSDFRLPQARHTRRLRALYALHSRHTQNESDLSGFSGDTGWGSVTATGSGGVWIEREVAG
uniref:(northern house mosquito) hypothetical protein n=1 Tax=Culex pipiens TaxID=7175 RepID=A0A8D8CQD1_CULPI